MDWDEASFESDAFDDYVLDQEKKEKEKVLDQEKKEKEKVLDQEKKEKVLDQEKKEKEKAQWEKTMAIMRAGAAAEQEKFMMKKKITADLKQSLEVFCIRY